MKMETHRMMFRELQCHRSDQFTPVTPVPPMARRLRTGVNMRDICAFNRVTLLHGITPVASRSSRSVQLAEKHTSQVGKSTFDFNKVNYHEHGKS
jgi:hypothetical protein